MSELQHLIEQAARAAGGAELQIVAEATRQMGVYGELSINIEMQLRGIAGRLA